MIWEATNADMPHLVRLGRLQAKEIQLRYEGMADNKPDFNYEDDLIIQTLSDFINHKKRVCFVSKNGFILLYLSTYGFCTNVRCVIEEVFFVEKEFRGSPQAFRLYKRAEKYTKENGCKGLIVGSISGINTNRTKSFYKKLGCTELGFSFHKNLTGVEK